MSPNNRKTMIFMTLILIIINLIGSLFGPVVVRPIFILMTAFNTLNYFFLKYLDGKLDKNEEKQTQKEKVKALYPKD